AVTAWPSFATRFAAGLADSDAPGLAALALRTRSDDVVEVLAYAASAGQLDHAGVLAAVTNEAHTGGQGSDAVTLRPAWALPLARVSALRLPDDGPDPAGAIAIYAHIWQRHGPAAIDAS